MKFPFWGKVIMEHQIQYGNSIKFSKKALNSTNKITEIFLEQKERRKEDRRKGERRKVCCDICKKPLGINPGIIAEGFKFVCVECFNKENL